MSNTQIIHLVIVVGGALIVAVFAGLVLVPAWNSYSRAWERVAAAFMSLYVLAAFIAIGVLAGAAVIFFWDRITG